MWMNMYQKLFCSYSAYNIFVFNPLMADMACIKNTKKLLSDENIYLDFIFNISSSWLLLEMLILLISNFLQTAH